MYITYVLRSEKDGKMYIGQTRNLAQRLIDHNSGKVQSTKSRRPLALIHYQNFLTQNEARWQEKKWKTAWGHVQLKKILNLRPSGPYGP